MRRRRLPRRASLIAIAAVVALGGVYLVLRDSSIVAIDRVEVRGASGPDAPKVEAALRDAARDMTTLNIDADELREAAAAYPTVRDVEIDRDFPDAVTITVLEHRPVAVVTQTGRRVPVAADGRLLQGATPADDLPTLALDAPTGTRIDDPRGRRLVALTAAAPDPLRRRAARATVSDRGLMLEMRRGPDLYFGSAQDLQAKWQAAARVLADPSAEGATYVDVRVPERPAVGGVASPSMQEIAAYGQPSTSG